MLMTPDEDLIRERIRRYMEDVRTYTNETRALIEADGYFYQGTLWPTERRSAERGLRWEACKAPHVTPTHEAGPARFGGDEDWSRTVITSIRVTGRRATVMTEELPAEPNFQDLGPEVLRYRLEKLDGEWRIASRNMLHAFPPPKWIRYLL
jgi:hypothetical protein